MTIATMLDHASVSHKANAINASLSGPSVDERFVWLEKLRCAARASLASKPRPMTLGVEANDVELFDALSLAMQRQFEALDRGIYGCLQIEGRTSSYDGWTSHEDLDLPDDPTRLEDDLEAYRYALKRLYRRQFEVTINELKTGAWPILLVDLLEPIDGRRNLEISKIPLIVSLHSSPEFLRQMSSAQIGHYLAVFRDTHASLAKRLEDVSNVARSSSGLGPKGGGGVIVVGAIIAAMQVLIYGIDVGYRIYRDIEDRERAESEKREADARDASDRAERRLLEWSREPKEIEGSSNHVDRFESNNRGIGEC